jgi:hypothetical protein
LETSLLGEESIILSFSFFLVLDSFSSLCCLLLSFLTTNLSMLHKALVTVLTEVDSDSDSVRDRGDDMILYFPLSFHSERFPILFLPLMLLNRLSDFYPTIILPRLRQFSLASYDFCPIPRIHYVGLNKEIYVHEYYLKNFCDEVKFPNWPVGEPLVFLRCVV